MAELDAGSCDSEDLNRLVPGLDLPPGEIRQKWSGLPDGYPVCFLEEHVDSGRLSEPVFGIAIYRVCSRCGLNFGPPIYIDGREEKNGT
jgi:hypothetical protein